MKYYEFQTYIPNINSKILNNYMINLPDNYCWACEHTGKYYDNNKQLISGIVKYGSNGWSLYLYNGNRIGQLTKTPSEKEYRHLLKELIFS